MYETEQHGEARALALQYSDSLFSPISAYLTSAQAGNVLGIQVTQEQSQLEIPPLTHGRRQMRDNSLNRQASTLKTSTGKR